MKINKCPVCGSGKVCRCYVPEEKKELVDMTDLINGFETIFLTLDRYMKDGSSHWHIDGFVAAPEGKKQPSDCDLFDVEWVDQGSAYPCEDCFEGNMYFPLPDERYLKVYFTS